MSEEVLIPAGRKLKAYGCMRSLHRRGVRTVVASEFERIPHFSSRYCSERVRLSAPPTDLEAYKDELLGVAMRPGVVTAVPVRECDAYVFARFREEFDEHVSLVTPPIETLRKVHDRLRLSREAEQAGVPTARTRRLSEVEAWDTDVVVKSRYNLLTGDYVDGFPRDTVAEVKDVRFVPAGTAPDVGAITETLNHDPIVQDYVPQAAKHLYCALWEHGEPLATYQHEQLRQNSWVGGGGVYRRSVHSPSVDEVASDLLSHLDWHGLVCIEYVQDEETGEWTFLEINPRVWQSLPEAVRAGADFPSYYWLCARGESERIDPGYELGVACHSAYGEVAHLLSLGRDDSPFLERPSVASRLWEVATSVVTNPRFDYLRLDDPRFVLGTLREAMATGVTVSRQYGSGGEPPAAGGRVPGPSSTREGSHREPEPLPPSSRR